MSSRLAFIYSRPCGVIRAEVSVFCFVPMERSTLSTCLSLLTWLKIPSETQRHSADRERSTLVNYALMSIDAVTLIFLSLQEETTNGWLTSITDENAFSSMISENYCAATISYASKTYWGIGCCYCSYCCCCCRSILSHHPLQNRQLESERTDDKPRRRLHCRWQ